jgi:polysaccharide export outer membrane protein
METNAMDSTELAPGRLAKDSGVAYALRRGAALAAWLTLAALSGCALAPGMTYDSAKNGASSSSGASRSAGSTVPDSVVAKGIAGAPSGSLVEITRQLVDDEAAARPKGIPQDVEKLFAKATPYEIGPGDILSIVVWDHPELNLPTGGAGGDGPSGASSVAPGYTVDTNGFIQYAYIGPLKVAGLTEMTVRDVLAGKLAKYVRQPQITVRIQTYRSKRVYLDGEVKTPGVQVLNDAAGGDQSRGRLHQQCRPLARGGNAWRRHGRRGYAGHDPQRL